MTILELDLANKTNNIFRRQTRWHQTAFLTVSTALAKISSAPVAAAA